jgi:thiamine biosynthesis lipoprotein
VSEPVESVHDSVVQTPDEIVGRSRAMAGPILIRLPYRCREAGVAGSADCDDAEALRLSERVGQLLSGFHAFERACTRFAPDSDLSRLNAAPRRWHRVPPVLLDAIWTARLAHETTDGLFDPRVLAELLALGYDA